MPDDGTYTAVLDRFEGELAVLILERDGDPLDQLDVPREALPGSPAPDAVYRVTVEDGEPVEFDHREAETERRREAAQSRFDRLSRRLSDAQDPEEGEDPVEDEEEAERDPDPECDDASGEDSDPDDDP